MPPRDRRLRIFVPSAAALLTDHAPHGEGLIAWNLLRGLAARGHDLVVCARGVALDTAVPFEVIETGPASRLESLEPLAYARRMRRLFRKLGGRGRFDLVHWVFPSQPDDVLLAAPDRTPYVIGPIFERWPAAARARTARPGDALRFAARPLYSAGHRRAHASARALLVATRGASTLVRAPDRPKVRMLAPGVDVSRFDAAPLPQTARILFLGSLERAKGVRDLVDAFAVVRAAVPDAELVLAGSGSEEAALRSAASAAGLNGAVRLVGRVPHGEVGNALRDASLLCLPSAGEPYGMAIVEAMAAGRAVVATDRGGPAELVDRERGGRLVPPGDAGALADALLDLLRDRDRLAEMGAFNRRRAIEELSLDATLDRLEEIYAEACT